MILDEGNEVFVLKDGDLTELSPVDFLNEDAFQSLLDPDEIVFSTR